MTDANESSVMYIPHTTSVRTADDDNKVKLRKVRRLISNYKQMKPGVDKDAYGNMVAKFISRDSIVELLMDTGEWDKIPTELKRKYKSKTDKRAHKLGKHLGLKRKIFPKSASKESAINDTTQLDLLSSSVENSLYSFLETMNSLD